MNYNKIYKNFINERINRVLDINGEIHHIIPKSLDGKDEKDNLIKLTYREHIFAHLLLQKIYPSNKALLYAANMMTNFHRVNSKQYGWLKEKYIFNGKQINISKKQLEYWLSILTLKEVYQLLDVPYYIITRKCKMYNIKIPKEIDILSKEKLESLLEQYTVPEIIKYTKLSKNQIFKRIKKYDLKVINTYKSILNKQLNKEFLENELKYNTVLDICKKYNFGRSILYKKIKEYNLETIKRKK